MNDGVEALLARVRKALGPGARPEPVKRDFRSLLPPGGKTFEERVELFARNAKDLSVAFIRCDSFEKAVEHLRGLSTGSGWKRVAFHRGGNAERAVAGLGIEVMATDGGYEKARLESCDAGITDCDALVAQTGSVLVTSRTTGGRGLSILPHHHVVLAGKDQLLSDLPEAFELLDKKYGKDYPSMVSFITGPSRTADIEQTLVLGAHGPKRLTILMF